MMRPSAILAMLCLFACAEQGNQESPRFSQVWSAVPADSVTVNVSRQTPVQLADQLAAISLDSVVGSHLDAAAYRVRIVDDGFVVLQVDDGRLMRFDSLGNLLADVMMDGVESPRSAAICVRGDSALVIDGAGLYNQPRRLVWLALREDIAAAAPDSMTVTLPFGTLGVGCTSIGDRWALMTTIPVEPGNMAARLTSQLLKVSPRYGLNETPLFSLTDRSEQMRDSSGLAMMQPSPWASPPLIAADYQGRLFVVDGPSGVVRILDTTATGAKIRGVTPQSRALTREAIDSVANAWRESEAAAAARRGPLSAEDEAMLDRLERAIRGGTPGELVPEVERLLVGADGSFALAASNWLSPDAERWDMFGSDGAYLGAVNLSGQSRGVGVQRGTLWYVTTIPDSSSQLIRVRPSKVLMPPE